MASKMVASLVYYLVAKKELVMAAEWVELMVV